MRGLPPEVKFASIGVFFHRHPKNYFKLKAQQCQVRSLVNNQTLLLLLTINNKNNQTLLLSLLLLLLLLLFHQRVLTPCRLLQGTDTQQAVQREPQPRSPQNAQVMVEFASLCERKC